MLDSGVDYRHIGVVTVHSGEVHNEVFLMSGVTVFPHKWPAVGGGLSGYYNACAAECGQLHSQKSEHREGKIFFHTSPKNSNFFAKSHLFLKFVTGMHKRSGIIVMLSLTVLLLLSSFRAGAQIVSIGSDPG